ncbi:MAG: hypothetical protein K0Q67_2563 [Cellvibrio sp.]|nr:hypothetical protein [Cellvibrio sp.]
MQQPLRWKKSWIRLPKPDHCIALVGKIVNEIDNVVLLDVSWGSQTPGCLVQVTNNNLRGAEAITSGAVRNAGLAMDMVGMWPSEQRHKTG